MASDESALWRSWIDRRDEAAFTALVTEHLGFATGLARRLGCSAADADDVTQSALVRLAGETREKPAHVGIRAWLGRDVLQESKKSARSHDRRIRYEGKASARAAEGIEAVDIRDAVQAALGTLDEQDRLAVELRFLHDLEYREVAFILGCSRLACRLRVHRAVKGMRRRLGRDASLIVASWPRLSDTPPDAGARIASAIAATRTAVPASTTLFVLGGILVGKKTIAVAAVLLLLLGGGGFLLVAGDRGGEGPRRDPAPAALGSDGHETTLAARAGAPAAGSPLADSQGAQPGSAPSGGDDAGSGGARAAPQVLRFIGMAVDGAGKPVGGAEVDVRLGPGPEEAPLAVAATSADGRFTIDVEVPAGEGTLRGLLVIRAGALTAMRGVVLRWPTLATSGVAPIGVNYGVLTLTSSHAFDVQVTSSCPGALPAWVSVVPRSGATTSSWARVVPSSGTTGPPWARVRTDAHGRARVAGVPAGSYRVIATADACGRGATDLALPHESPDPVPVAIGPERVLEVLVVAAGSEDPIPGATLNVLEVLSPRETAPLEGSPAVAPTDANGRTRVRGLGDKEQLGIWAYAAGYSSGAPGRNHAMVDPGRTEVRITLARARIVTWPLVKGEAPVPVDGTVIRVLPYRRSVGETVPPQGRVVRGALVVEGFAADLYLFGALAVAPDGSCAVLSSELGKDVGGETSFRPARRIEVHVADGDGAPVPGVTVFARTHDRRPLGAPVATDAEGRAALDGISLGAYETADVYAKLGSGAVPQGAQETLIGTADPALPVTKLEATLQREREILARVRLAGKPALPATYVLDQGAGNYASRAYGRGVEEDGEKGTLRFPWRPTSRGGGGMTGLSAQGYLPTLVTIPPGTGSIEVEFALEPAGEVLIRVTPPADGICRVLLQRWDAGRSAWAQYDNAPLNPDSEGVVRRGELPPGRYRAVDPLSWAAGESFEVVAGGAPGETRLDLSGAGWLRGRIVAPEGTDFGGVRLRIEGTAWVPTSDFPSQDDRWVKGTGEFEVRVPGRMAVTLVPTHAFLAPATQGGSVTVTGPRESVELRLVAGNTATVRFDRELRIEGYTGAPRWERVLFFHGEPTGAPALERQAKIEGATARFGGFAPGTWTLWIDSPPFAPTVLRDVKLTTGETDLGTAPVSEGSSVRVKLLVQEDQAPPRYFVSVTRDDEGIPYVRYVNSQGGAEVRVTGLCAGRYKVVGFPVTGVVAGAALEETVDLDGKTDASLTVDLR